MAENLQIPERSSLNLPPDYTQITLKKRQHIRDLELYYEHIVWEGQRYVYHYSLYVYRAGKRQLISYIYTKERMKITSGWLLIAPLTANDIFTKELKTQKSYCPSLNLLLQWLGNMT